MSIKYSEYLDSVAVKHRTLSYNSIAPRREPGTSGALPRIKLSFSEVAELLATYCGVRILDQLKAVVPLAAYLMLFQVLILKIFYYLINRLSSLQTIIQSCVSLLYITTSYYGITYRFFDFYR